jgi:S-adenosylmethionine decarboxylase proenzyme
MQGLHLTADLRDCRCDPLLTSDGEALRALCLAAVTETGLLPVGELFHRFAPAAQASPQSGVTGVVLLAESHLAVHTWPEFGGVTIDAYVCNFGTDNTARAEALMARLVAAFAPMRVQQQRLRRGLPA